MLPIAKFEINLEIIFQSLNLFFKLNHLNGNTKDF